MSLHPHAVKESPLIGLIGMGGGSTNLALYLASAEGAYQIEKSLRFTTEDSDKLEFTPSSDGNRRRWTWSGWVKKWDVTTDTHQTIWSIGDDNNYYFRLYLYSASTGSARLNWNEQYSGGTELIDLLTEQSFRDPGAWFHICLSCDMTHSIDTERATLHINGKRVTSFNGTANYPDNATLSSPVNKSGVKVSYGNDARYSGKQLNSYLSDVQFIDGLALPPQAFGQFSSAGAWDPKTFALPAYNTDAGSPTWSNQWESASDAGSTGNVDNGTRLFDGNENTYASNAQSSTYVRWVPSSPISYDSLEIKFGAINNGDNQVFINGVVQNVTSSSGQMYIDNNGTLSEIKLQDIGSTHGRIFYVKINGTILEDGKTDVATRNNPNAGTTWSGQVSGSFNGSYVASNAFDGQVGGTWAIPADGQDVTWTPSSAITANTLIRIWINKNGTGGTLTQNGTDLTSGLSAGDQWVNLPSKTLTTLVWGSNGAYNQIQLMAVEVDNHLLIDGTVDNSYHLKFDDASDLGKDSLNSNDFTPTNITSGTSLNTSDVSVASAGGALPIFNTTDTYGRVKGSGNRTDSVSNPYLWLPLNGSDGGTTFTDASSEGKSVTVRGNAQTVTSESKFYGSCAYFDGSGDYLELADSSHWQINSDWTVEFWVKFAHAPDATSETLIGQEGSGASYQNWGIMRRGTGESDPKTIKFAHRDNSDNWEYIASDNAIEDEAWHHVAVSLDSNTARMFIDGVVQSTTFTHATGTGFDTTTPLTIGAQYHSSGRFPLQGWIQDVRIYGDGKYTSTFTVPNDPEFFPASKVDLLNDTPTNYEDSGTVRGNFASFNPLFNNSMTLSQGNFTVAPTGSNRGVGSTFMPSTGKWYFEVEIEDRGSDTQAGICGDNKAILDTYGGNHANSWCMILYNTSTDGIKINSGTQTTYGDVYQSADTFQCAYDMDAGKVWFGRNGSWFASGNPATGANASFTNVSGQAGPQVGSNTSGGTLHLNTGQRSFKYTPPTDFKALCTENITDPFADTDAANDPSYYFDVKTYTGTGSSRDFEFNFGPDLVWLFNRSGSGTHRVNDQLLGTNNYLKLDQNGGATAEANNITAWNSDGYTMGTNGDINASDGSFVSFNWDAGTAANGSVDSCSQTVNGQWTNPTAGFSITSWEGGGGAGQTVAHGLGAKPDFFITKRVDGSQDYLCYHSALGAEYMATINADDEPEDRTEAFNDTEPTATLITYGSESRVSNADTHITYAWTSIPSFSIFTSYTGNGSSTGPFVHCGFTPRWIMIKESGNAGHWFIHDTERSPLNPDNAQLWANTNVAEDSSTINDNSSRNQLDVLSNGFKLRDDGTGLNRSSGNYIVAAFAEHPFKTARAR